MTRSSGISFLAAALLAAAACNGAAGETRPQRHEVEISAFAFVPDTLTVAPGDTVVWINRDAVPHTATSEEGGWDSGSIAAGGSWGWVAPASAGQAGYVCTFHPTMTGVVQVQ